MRPGAPRRARCPGDTTACAVRGYGYYEARYFDAVDHAFTCSQFLTDVYRDKVGLVSTPLEPPIDWASVLAPLESRAFVTFVNPSPHKGLLLFALLADMLGARRPDIPILVVQSGHSGGSLNAIPGVDFSRYPQIMAALSHLLQEDEEVIASAVEAPATAASTVEIFWARVAEWAAERSIDPLAGTGGEGDEMAET